MPPAFSIPQPICKVLSGLFLSPGHRLSRARPGLQQPIYRVTQPGRVPSGLPKSGCGRYRTIRLTFSNQDSGSLLVSLMMQHTFILSPSSVPTESLER